MFNSQKSLALEVLVIETFYISAQNLQPPIFLSVAFFICDLLEECSEINVFHHKTTPAHCNFMEILVMRYQRRMKSV